MENEKSMLITTRLLWQVECTQEGMCTTGAKDGVCDRGKSGHSEACWY